MKKRKEYFSFRRKERNKEERSHLTPKKKIFFLLGRGAERENERERNMDVREKHRSAASCTPLDQAPNPHPGMCQVGKSNWQPFSLGDEVQPTEPH